MGHLSKTPLDEVIEVLRRTAAGPFGQGAIVHCFNAPGELVLGGENVAELSNRAFRMMEPRGLCFLRRHSPLTGTVRAPR